MGTCNFLFHFPAIMFTCTTCMLQFDLRTVYNTHIRKCIPISNFATHTGQHVTATRNKEGVFLCYCSHPDYPKPTGYFTTNNLRKHMKKVQSTWIGPNNNKQSAQLKVKLCMIPISMTCNWFWMIQFSRYVLFTHNLLVLPCSLHHNLPFTFPCLPCLLMWVPASLHTYI